MGKFFGNLHAVLGAGLVLAFLVIGSFTGWTGEGAAAVTDDVMRWLHLFFGILWIGLLYYLNFVQVPTMPKVPAELKKGVTGFIAPSVLFFFRWAALLTVLTGLGIAFHNGYGAQALTFGGSGADGINLIGLGMWLALIISRRARPMPAFGSMPKSKARSGLATFIMILSGAGGMLARSVVVRSKGRAPA